MIVYYFKSVRFQVQEEETFTLHGVTEIVSFIYVYMIVYKVNVFERLVNIFDVSRH